MTVSKRLLAVLLCLLLGIACLPSIVSAEDTGESAVSRYKVLQDKLAPDQTIPLNGNEHKLHTNFVFNEAVQAKFAAGEQRELALYMNLYIENKDDPGNLNILEGSDGFRRVVIQYYESSTNTYHEAVWLFERMKLQSGWNPLVLSFAADATDTEGAYLAHVQSIKPDANQTFEVYFPNLKNNQKNYEIKVSNMMVVDTAFDTDGNSLRIVDPDPPDYTILQNVIPNQAYTYNPSGNMFLANSTLSFNDAVKQTAVEDLALYMDVYLENTDDPSYLNLFSDAAGQIAIQHFDSSTTTYYEVRWLVQQQLSNLQWKKGWNQVLLTFDANNTDPNGVDPFGTPNLLWEEVQGFHFRVDNLPADKDYSAFKIRLANVNIVDTSRSEANPDIGSMQLPAYRAVGEINDRVIHIKATNGVYERTLTGWNISTGTMNKNDLAVFANVYLPDDSAGNTVTLGLTNTDGQELTWTADLQVGWNALQLALSDAIPADASAANFNAFRITLPSSVEQDVRLGTAYIINTKAKYSEQQLTLSRVFGDHMLFQQNKPINVWGYAAAGDTVTVTLTETESGKVAGTSAVTANADNEFTASLPALPGSYTAYTLTIEDKDAVGVKATQTYTDVVIGELWIASGQSNMELMVQQDYNANTILAEANNSNVRYLKERSWPYNDKVEHPLTPNFDIVDTYWGTAADTTKLRNVSSIGYQFALQLQEELDIPVGVVSNASGGSRIDCWISREAIDGNAEIKSYLQSRNEYFDENNWPTANNRMSTLYNEIIGPLAGFEEGKGMQITGAIWYQGESNLNFNGKYDKFLELLQNDWERTFGFAEDEEMPLIFAHIAPHPYGGYLISGQSEDMTRAWSQHKDSMAQVTLYDCWLVHQNGDGSMNSPIHPTMKTPVAERYALAAMDLMYGGTLDATAPVYKSMTITDNGRIRVTFDKVGDGLSVIGGGNDIHGFAIAGEDGVFVNAKARVVSVDTVEVWNDRVTDPKNVTYAYGNFMSAYDLKNSAGFPAAAFRTTASGTFFQPQDWIYADGKEWAHYNDGQEHADYLDRWAVAAGDAAITYDAEIKAEGSASLKLTYQSNTAAVTPIWTTDVTGTTIALADTYKPTAKAEYLTVYAANPDAREKTLQLQIVSGGQVYTAAVAENSTATMAAESDFYPYSFKLQNLTNNSGQAVTNAQSILQNLTEIRFAVTDTAAGTIYLDDIQFGMDNAENALVQRVLYGDVNDDKNVTAEDALLALQGATGKITLSANQVEAANVDGEAGVTPNDALLILQYATQKISSFPIAD